MTHLISTHKVSHNTKTLFPFRNLRQKKNLRQWQVADLLGTDQAHISKLERGLRPTHKDIARYRKAFGVDWRLSDEKAS